MTFGGFEILLLVIGAVLLLVYPGGLSRLGETMNERWDDLKTQFQKGQQSESSEHDPPDEPDGTS